MMSISLNGRNIPFAGGSLADVLACHPVEMPFAVALNSVFVPRQQYAATRVQDGDCIDIVRPVAGG